MKMLLHADFPNGPFGDPALYVWEINGKRSMLFDCGDLTNLSTRQLLKVGHIFLSHCHMDHFFGFDLFLRVHVGSEKQVTIFGPPETSEHIRGKLQGYTWNLIQDQNLEFIAVDLNPIDRIKTTTRFHARNRFTASQKYIEQWNPDEPILDAGTYQIRTAMLDHRTPSMAYAIEEKLTVGIDSAVIKEMKLQPGPWINDLKNLFLFGDLKNTHVVAKTFSGDEKNFRAQELADKLLIPRQRHKIAYVTDGATHLENRKILLGLVQGADVLFHESCFLDADARLAIETKHFTTTFVGRLAEEAKIKKLVPFHFSKRYLDRPSEILNEIADYFHGDIAIPHS